MLNKDTHTAKSITVKKYSYLQLGLEWNMFKNKGIFQRGLNWDICFVLLQNTNNLHKVKIILERNIYI
jgi:hypothetical protein